MGAEATVPSPDTETRRHSRAARYTVYGRWVAPAGAQRAPHTAHIHCSPLAARLHPQVQTVKERQEWIWHVASGHRQPSQPSLAAERVLPADLLDRLTLADYAWATSLVSSRVFLLGTNGSTDSGHMYLLPIMDMGNHANGCPNTIPRMNTWSEEQYGTGGSGGVEGALPLQLIAGADYAAGEEVCTAYRPNMRNDVTLLGEYEYWRGARWRPSTQPLASNTTLVSVAHLSSLEF